MKRSSCSAILCHSRRFTPALSRSLLILFLHFNFGLPFLLPLSSVFHATIVTLLNRSRYESCPLHSAPHYLRFQMLISSFQPSLNSPIFLLSYIYIYVCMYVCTYVRTHARTHARTHIHTYIYIYIYIYILYILFAYIIKHT